MGPMRGRPRNPSRNQPANLRQTLARQSFMAKQASLIISEEESLTEELTNMLKEKRQTRYIVNTPRHSSGNLSQIFASNSSNSRMSSADNKENLNSTQNRKKIKLIQNKARLTLHDFNSPQKSQKNKSSKSLHDFTSGSNCTLADNDSFLVPAKKDWPLQQVSFAIPDDLFSNDSVEDQANVSKAEKTDLDEQKNELERKRATLRETRARVTLHDFNSPPKPQSNDGEKSLNEFTVDSNSGTIDGDFSFSLQRAENLPEKRNSSIPDHLFGRESVENSDKKESPNLNIEDEVESKRTTLRETRARVTLHDFNTTSSSNISRKNDQGISLHDFKYDSLDNCENYTQADSFSERKAKKLSLINNCASMPSGFLEDETKVDKSENEIVPELHCQENNSLKISEISKEKLHDSIISNKSLTRKSKRKLETSDRSIDTEVSTTSRRTTRSSISTMNSSENPELSDLGPLRDAVHNSETLVGSFLALGQNLTFVKEANKLFLENHESVRLLKDSPTKKMETLVDYSEQMSHSNLPVPDCENESVNRVDYSKEMSHSSLPVADCENESANRSDLSNKSLKSNSSKNKDFSMEGTKGSSTLVLNLSEEMNDSNTLTSFENQSENRSLRSNQSKNSQYSSTKMDSIQEKNDLYSTVLDYSEDQSNGSSLRSNDSGRSTKSSRSTSIDPTNESSMTSDNQSENISYNNTVDISKNQSKNTSRRPSENQNTTIDISKNESINISRGSNLNQNTTANISKNENINISRSSSRNQTTTMNNSKNQSINISHRSSENQNTIADISKNHSINTSRRSTRSQRSNISTKSKSETITSNRFSKTFSKEDHENNSSVLNKISTYFKDLSVNDSLPDKTANDKSLNLSNSKRLKLVDYSEMSSSTPEISEFENENINGSHENSSTASRLQKSTISNHFKNTTEINPIDDGLKTLDISENQSKNSSCRSTRSQRSNFSTKSKNTTMTSSPFNTTFSKEEHENNSSVLNKISPHFKDLNVNDSPTENNDDFLIPNEENEETLVEKNKSVVNVSKSNTTKRLKLVDYSDMSKSSRSFPSNASNSSKTETLKKHETKTLNQASVEEKHENSSLSKETSDDENGSEISQEENDTDVESETVKEKSESAFGVSNISPISSENEDSNDNNSEFNVVLKSNHEPDRVSLRSGFTRASTLGSLSLLSERIPNAQSTMIAARASKKSYQMPNRTANIQKILYDLKSKQFVPGKYQPRQNFGPQLDRPKPFALANVRPIVSNKKPVISAKSVKSSNPKINKATIIDGVPYKNPQKKKLAPYIEHMKPYIEKRLNLPNSIEKDYKLHKLLMYVNDCTKYILAKKDYQGKLVDALMYKLAKANIVATRKEFYSFVSDYLPRKAGWKIIPTPLPFVPDVDLNTLDDYIIKDDE